MSGAAWHPAPPPGLAAAVALVTDRIERAVKEAVAGVPTGSPAYAICLWTADDTADLVPANISIGVDADRQRLLAGLASPAEAFWAIWNPGEHAVEGLIEFTDPSTEDDFAAAAQEIVAWTAGVGFAYPARWVQEDVAVRLTREPPLPLVTDDFVTYVFEEGADLVPSLRYITPPEKQRMLERKQLLIDDPDALEGGFRWEERP